MAKSKSCTEQSRTYLKKSRLCCQECPDDKPKNQKQTDKYKRQVQREFNITQI